MQNTYKKIINTGPATTNLTVNDKIAEGKDSITLGQTSPTDANVPTGSSIKAIRVQGGVGNLQAVGINVGVCLQYVTGSQSLRVDPLAQGGDSQRNQVIKSWMRLLAPNEHFNIDQLVKIPKKFQRMAEGKQWILSRSSNGVNRTEAFQFIYKVRT